MNLTNFKNPFRQAGKNGQILEGSSQKIIVHFFVVHVLHTALISIPTLKLFFIKLYIFQQPKKLILKYSMPQLADENKRMIFKQSQTHLKKYKIQSRSISPSWRKRKNLKQSQIWTIFLWLTFWYARISKTDQLTIVVNDLYISLDNFRKVFEKSQNS